MQKKSSSLEVEVTEENYDVALKYLKDRYENKKLIKNNPKEFKGFNHIK